MFYTYRQNNTGGDFIVDPEAGISVQVIVEADSLDEANTRAETIGLYFDGVRDGMDCGCCGDRWYTPWGEGNEVPCDQVGRPLVEVKPDPTYGGQTNWAGELPDTFVHLKDGRKFGFHLVNGYYVYLGEPSDLVEGLPAVGPKEIG